MNQQLLTRRLAEISGMAQALQEATIDEESRKIADLMEGGLHRIIETLQAEERLESTTRFQALHPCNHQWTCAKCGERGE
mgnify:CR=1 FL=1